MDYDDYRMVYSGVLGENETLDSLYEKFNIGRPLDFTGHSFSVSDVVAIKRDGEVTAHYVDSFGYTELPEFFSQREKNMEQEKDAGLQGSSLQEPQNSDISKLYEKVYPLLYMHTITYAMEHGRADGYLELRKLNLDCKNAIEDTIQENFDGMHLAHDAAKRIIEEYGAERVVFILANTVQHLEYDGRFSIGSKAWAKGYGIPENVNRGMDMNADYVVNSHPAVESGRDTAGLEKQSAEPEKAAENSPKTGRGISGGSKKQSVLNALSLVDNFNILFLQQHMKKILCRTCKSLSCSGFNHFVTFIYGSYCFIIWDVCKSG